MDVRVRNRWVGYLNRSYLSIKSSVLERLGQVCPEITDHSESNILVIIIDIFSGITEMINYYIDNMAREAFVSTARRYSSIVKHTRLIDYRIKAIVTSKVDIQVSFFNSLDVPKACEADIFLPSGTIFTTNNNIEFMTYADITIPMGTKVTNIPAEQKSLKSDINLGTTDGNTEQVFSLGTDYVHNSLHLEIGGEPWELVDTLGRSKPTDKHFIVEISTDKLAYIRFGDNINGMKPEAGLDLIGDYYTSFGVLGNVDINTIVNTQFDFAINGVDKFKVTNLYKAVAGTNYEDLERIRRSAPLHTRTLDRAVTKQDYLDISLLSPGVDKAYVDFNCGKYVLFYISPNGGGIAQQALLESTKEYIEKRKMITTFIDVKPAGESYIALKINVTAKFRRDIVQTRNDVKEALLNAYSYDNSDINKMIRTSDIIALVDNLEKVDYLDLEYIYLKPYMRSTNNENVLYSTELNHDILINQGSTTIINWTIQFDGTYMRLYKNNSFKVNLNIGESYTDEANIMTLTINPGTYEIGNKWVFKTYPINKNINLSDFSVPILREQDLVLTVDEQIAVN